MNEHPLTRSYKRIQHTAVLLVFAATLVLLATVVCGWALEVPPKPKGRVSDYTGTLAAPEIRALNKSLAQFEKETTNQIAVLIIPTLTGDSLEDYSIRLAEKWQIGQKGRDNGVILIIVKQDRKIRIEVGYGLEGVLPDSLAGDIIRQVIAPQFRQNKFREGIRAGIAAIMAVTRGEYGAAARSKRIGNIASWFWPLFVFILLFSAIAGRLSRRRYYSRRHGGWYLGGPFWWGGGGGGFGGGFSGGGGGFGGGGASGGW